MGDYGCVTIVGSENFRAEVFDIDAVKGYYRGSRFDWSGIIKNVYLENKVFYGDWITPHDPYNPEHARSICEEYTQLGWDEASVGEEFVKIGVGRLLKKEGEYNSVDIAYEFVEVPEWQVTHDDSTVSYTQVLTSPTGYSYQLEKKLEIDSTNDPTILVTHSLTNIGEKDIECGQYVHNFTIINHQPNHGQGYSVEFNFQPVQKTPELKNKTTLQGNKLVFDTKMEPGEDFEEQFHEEKTVENASFTANFSDPDTNEVTGYHHQGSLPLYYMNLWGIDSNFSPEPWIVIKLKPTESVTWTNTYTYF
eukprot:TRINITY_DN1430_c0_g1_i3.p1 TRINITY_DN1430_c0_g1~~TRINITY_DN1430_c0_g1_i3.p1  ORF type:complete len:306 (-),score=67.03 TRINITY_DN1430_c0_g1_i3:1104-2021(-)